MTVNGRDRQTPRRRYAAVQQVATEREREREREGAAEGSELGGGGVTWRALDGRGRR